MKSYYSTPQVAQMLKISPGCLSRAVWDGRLESPEKGPGGAFLWAEEDIHRASWVLRRRSADDVLNKKGVKEDEEENKKSS